MLGEWIMEQYYMIQMADFSEQQVPSKTGKQTRMCLVDWLIIFAILKKIKSAGETGWNRLGSVPVTPPPSITGCPSSFSQVCHVSPRYVTRGRLHTLYVGPLHTRGPSSVVQVRHVQMRLYPPQEAFWTLGDWLTMNPGLLLPLVAYL